jgi:hypothetical protein
MRFAGRVGRSLLFVIRDHPAPVLGKLGVLAVGCELFFSGRRSVSRVM